MLSDSVTRYVVGFLFAAPSWGLNVSLIRKARPDWQKGRHNGIGGKVEEGETPVQAMAREFRKETGWEGEIAWTEYVTLRDRRGYVVHFFRATASVDVQLAIERNTRDAEEPVTNFHISNIDVGIEAGKIIGNLGWLIPMALDTDVASADVVETVSA